MRWSCFVHWKLLLVLLIACTQSDSDGREEAGDREEGALAISQQALSSDADGDGVPDATDNCPQLANPNQADRNGIGPGDACELSLVLSHGLLNQYARFQSHKELILSFSPLTFSFGPDLVRTDAPAPVHAVAHFALLSRRLGVRSAGELLPGHADTISGNEVLRIRLGTSSLLGGAKASEVYLRLEGTATVSVAFFEGNSARGSQSINVTGTSLQRFAPAAGARFDRIELRVAGGRVSLRGPGEIAIFTLGQAQLTCPAGYQSVAGSCVDIDECAGLNHGCDVLTQCSNTPGSYSCGPCPTGYRGTGSTSCVDIDECAEDLDGCDPLVTCSNTAGSYQCGACPPGYRGDGRSCVDIDECAEELDSCDPLVVCTNRAGGYDCGQCPTGYSGGGSTGCMDVDECSGPQRVCDVLVTCSNTEGGYQCGACPPGYTGDGTSCTDIDECLDGSADCSPLVQCGNTAGGYQCGACPAGFEGDGHTCADLDECSNGTAQCAAGVECTNTVGSYTCGACPDGYTGDGRTCADIDECLAHPCDPRVSCSNTPGSFLCGACPAGFRGDGHAGCVDIDECAEDLDTCSPLVTCGNTLGGYTCSECPAGYEGDGHVCDDVDECARGTDQCDALVTCTNTPGGYTCGPCPSGYRSEAGVCIDLDECADEPCAALTECSNLPGSYTCSACPPGYTGDGYAGCADIDECAVENGGCLESERCENLPGSVRCEPCAPGSVGVVTQCGVGACASTGLTSCVRGEVRDSCLPGAPAFTDATCNALDDDCDAVTDEDFPVTPNSCGTGVCAAMGAIRCIGGQVVDTCVPGAPAGPDVICDGLDQDCDGNADEDFVPQVVQCGVGACLRSVELQCVNGALSGPECVPGVPADSDTTCDGIDDDCNGLVDDQYVPIATSCGFGLCASSGVLSCEQGVLVDSCMIGGGLSVICPAPDSCHDVGTCDLVTGACANPIKPDGTLCADANVCDGEEVCIAGSCGSGTALPVDDNNPCTVDSCDPALGALHTPTPGVSCSDGNACNGLELCNAQGACVADPGSSFCCDAEEFRDPLAATPIDPTRATDFVTQVEPLYTGPFAVQRPVAPGTIEPRRAAVIRGRVLDSHGVGVSCAEVSVVNAPQLGVVRTRPDGSYAMAVNGGGALSLQVKLPGFVAAYRRVSTQWNRFALAQDVRLVALESAQAVSSSAPGFTPLVGALETDASGTRQATLLVPAGTSLTLAGETQPRTNFALRVTEVTNLSKHGKDGMPAQLPAQTAFSYALSLDVEGSESQPGTFNQAVPVYVDNFLGIGNGESVPLGRFDARLQQWIAEPSGRVVRVVGTDESGAATLDIDEVPGADDPTALGITPGERLELAGRFAPGTSLWRFAVQGVSLWDCGWGWGPDESAVAPSVAAPSRDDALGVSPARSAGPERQVLQKSIPIAGTPFSLSYSSARQKGSAHVRSLRIPVTSATLPSGLRGVTLEIEVGGRLLRPDLGTLQPNLTYQFNWDGLDASGRRLSGPQSISTRLGYSFDASYRRTARFRDHGNSVAIAASGSRVQGTLWQSWAGLIGATEADYAGLGGWTLSAHHQLDPVTGAVQFGDGDQPSADVLFGSIRTFAGTGTGASGGSAVTPAPGSLATSANMTLGPAVAVTPDGHVFIYGASGILEIDTEGRIWPVTGKEQARGGEDVPATDAWPRNVTGLVVGPDNALYFSQDAEGVSNAGGSKIRRIDLLTRRVRTVAGTDASGFNGDGPALTRQLWAPRQLAFDADGALYAADSFNNRVVRIKDGVLSTVANGLNRPTGIAVSPDGVLYVSDASNRVYQIGVDGRRSVFAGTAVPTDLPAEGVPATSAWLSGPNQLAWWDGELFIVDRAYSRVRRVRQDGVIESVVGNGMAPAGLSTPRPYVDGAPASRSVLSFPEGLGFGPDGSLYVISTLHNRVLRLPRSQRRVLADGTHYVASADGKLLHLFSSQGRHLRSHDAYSGALVWSYGYDANGLPSSITDGYGNVTRVERDLAARTIAIIAADGQETQLVLDANGHLERVTQPDGGRFTMQHDANGLLRELRYPKANAEGGAAFAFAYASDGRLASITEPSSGSYTFTRANIAGGWAVQRVSPLGRTTLDEAWKQGLLHQRRVTYADQTVSTFAGTSDGTTGLTGPDNVNYDGRLLRADGTTVYTRMDPNGAYGLGSAFLGASLTVLPSGLRHVETQTRTTTVEPVSGRILSENIARTTAGRTTSASYDATSRVLTTTSPAGRRSFAELDAQGRLVRLEQEGVLPISYAYDARGRLDRVTQGARTSSSAYVAFGPAAGYLERTTAAEQEVTYQRDAMGRALTTTWSDASQVAYGWDAAGNLTSLTPPGRTPHQQGFDLLGQQTSYTPPALSDVPAPETLYAHDLDRNLQDVTRPDGTSLHWDYDAAGRVDALTTPQGVYDYQYYGNGACTNCAPGRTSRIVSPSNVTLDFSYDGTLVTGFSYSGAASGSVRFSYGADLRVSTETVVGGAGSSTIRFGYDADGVLTCASATNCSPAASDALLVTLDPSVARVQGVTLGVTSEARSYNTYGELATLQGSAGSTQLYAEVMDSPSGPRDALGRIATRSEQMPSSVRTLEYGYDLRGRLEDVIEDGVNIAHYVYDANGNRLEAHTPDGVTLATYDAQDRLLTQGSFEYGYTANGELRTRTDTLTGATTTYTYDARGNLIQVDLPSGDRIEYVIDGLDRRVGKKRNGVLVKRWLYRDQRRIAAELDGAGNLVSRFVYVTRADVPDYVIRGGNTYRIFSDHLGSPRVVVNVANPADMPLVVDYGAFGNIESGAASADWLPMGFAGGHWDGEVGLVRFGARDYDPSSGRYTAKDPLLFTRGATNLYTFFGGDPVNQRAVSGERAW